MSSATKEVLDEFGYFDLQLRGDIELKVMYCISLDCGMDAALCASQITSCSRDGASAYTLGPCRNGKQTQFSPDEATFSDKLI